MADLDDLEKCIAQDLDGLDLQETEEARRKEEMLAKKKREQDEQRQRDLKLSSDDVEEEIEEDIVEAPQRSKSNKINKENIPQRNSGHQAPSKPVVLDDSIDDDVEDEAPPQEEEDIAFSKVVEAKGVDLSKIPLPEDSLDMFLK